ncbi:MULTISPECIES: hypothetical protein [Paenibacillus]|uniref:hypothetical protein n=1 Tax=Paenibacillus TaxID=44249 RepID=UPI003340FB3D
MYPDICLGIARAALAGLSKSADNQSKRLEPLWQMFQRYGSLRVVATIAGMRGLTDIPNLPLPLQGLDEVACHELENILSILQNATES